MQERTPDEVLQLISDEGAEVVDVRFCDLPGLMQHFSMPASQLTADVFEEGVGLARRCGKYLDDAEKRIETLTRDDSGVLRTEQFDLADDERA